MGAEGSCALGGRGDRSQHWAAALAEPQLLTYQGRVHGFPWSQQQATCQAAPHGTTVSAVSALTGSVFSFPFLPTQKEMTERICH